MMTSLASKLKVKLDKLSSTGEMKRSAEQSVSPEEPAAKLQKVENNGVAQVMPGDERESTSGTGGSKVGTEGGGKLSLEEWKREKEKMREVALGEDKKRIAKSMPEEVLVEIRRLEEQCKSGKPPTPASFKVFTNSVLVDLLRYNDRTSSEGPRKPELVTAVCDSMVNGTPPRCPKCHNTTLRFSNGRKKHGKRYYWCPGYWGGTHFWSCGFKADRAEVKRRPWEAPP